MCTKLDRAWNHAKASIKEKQSQPQKLGLAEILCIRSSWGGTKRQYKKNAQKWGLVRNGNGTHRTRG